MKFFKSFKSRISAVFFIASFLISASFLTALYNRAVADELENIRTYLKSVAALGSSFLDAQDVLQVPLQKGCEQSLVRHRVIAHLKRIARIDERIDDVYAMVPSGREGTFLFVANAAQESDPLACGEPYDINRFPEMVNGFRVPSADRAITKDRWGEWLSGYAPIVDSTGQSIGLLGIDIDAQIYRDLQGAYLERFLWVMAIASALSLLVGILGSQWLTHPIGQIIAGMERVSEGDLNYHLRSFPQQEFGRIASIFNKMTDSLKVLMEQHARTVRDRERINRELEIAADLQQRALPESPPVTPDLDIAAKSIPAREVGGDYYDFITMDSDRIGFVVADAAGKGFSGTIFMTNSRSVFRVISSEEKIPTVTLRRTNNFISGDGSTSKGMFITFLYCLYDRRTKRLTYSNAGHYLPLVYSSRRRKFLQLGAAGLPLGVYPDQEYPEETVQLETGDWVILYTDGILDAMNVRKDMFGMTRLMQIVEENPETDAGTLLRKIEDEVRAFAGGEPQMDDITLLLFKVLQS